jgi:hypothetical protein
MLEQKQWYGVGLAGEDCEIGISAQLPSATW